MDLLGYPIDSHINLLLKMGLARPLAGPANKTGPAVSAHSLTVPSCPVMFGPV